MVLDKGLLYQLRAMGQALPLSLKGSWEGDVASWDFSRQDHLLSGSQVLGFLDLKKTQAQSVDFNVMASSPCTWLCICKEVGRGPAASQALGSS